MVGQKELQIRFRELIERDAFPRFSIIAGKKGSGKKTVGKCIADMLGYSYIVWENKIDDIRSLIEFMWQQDKPTVYCIPDYENMSQGAKNSILKICEEPPNNSYIILTTSLKDVVLPTILNRGTTFEIQAYSKEELLEIAKANYQKFDQGDVERKLTFCETPGEVIECEALNSEEFIQFMNKFWSNIGKASAGNALKVAQNIKIKDEGSGYDLNLFINSLMTLNSDSEVSQVKSKIFEELIRAKKDIQLKFNKQFILDNLLLNIRGIKNGTI